MQQRIARLIERHGHETVLEIIEAALEELMDVRASIVASAPDDVRVYRVDADPDPSPSNEQSAGILGEQTREPQPPSVGILGSAPSGGDGTGVA